MLNDDYWFEERYQDAYYALHGEFAPESESPKENR